MPESNDIDAQIKRLDPEEQYQLKQLKRYLLDIAKKAAVNPKAVGETLPEAVLIGDSENRKLSKSMVEITERAIDLSVRRDPVPLSNALFPIIGSAIRKALNKVMSDMMLAMNNGLEKTISFKRIAWRIEAKKTGVSFPEIVLRNTLDFRVEHVFLIHTKTGLLLHSVSQENSAAGDSDMVASMLTVIRDYIKDSLSLKKSDAVDVITAGEYSLVVEDGPDMSLAAIVRGMYDSSIRKALQDSLETMQLRFSGELVSFKGNTEPFKETDAFLRPCLAERERGGNKKPVRAFVALGLVALALAGFIAWYVFVGIKYDAFIQALDKEPGILVADSFRRFSALNIKLLRDPRARSVADIATKHSIPPDAITVSEEAFISPEFGPYFGARVVPDELLALAKQLAAYRLFFMQDSGDLRAGQEDTLREVGLLISSLIAKAKQYGFTLSVEITGHSAGTVQDDKAIAVSEDRAKKALNLFTKVNAPLVSYVKTRGAGVAEPLASPEITEEDREQNRSVSFKALFE